LKAQQVAQTPNNETYNEEQPAAVIDAAGGNYTVIRLLTSVLCYGYTRTNMLKVIVKNAGSNALVMVVKICFSFIMAPVIVHALGNYDYGLWEIVFSLIGYMGLMDIGMRPAVIRYVAKFKAENDRTKLNQVFSTAVVFNATVGTVCCVVLFCWAYLKPELLAESAGSSSERYVFFLIIIGIQIFFQFPGYIAQSFHEGYQRHYLNNSITLINTFVGNTILYYLLTHGYGLLTLALGNCIGISFKYIVYFLLLRKEKYGGYSFGRKDLSKPVLKMLVGFGAKTFVQSTASTIAGSVGTIVIGFFLGPAMVPFYTIPGRLISYIREFSMTITNVFLPVFSHLHAGGEQEKLRNLYASSTKFITGLTFPAAIGVCMLGPAFITRWIGAEYGESAGLLLFLLTGGFVLLMMNPLHQRYLTGIGRIEFLARIRVITAVALLLLCLLLVKPFGKEGVAGAFLLNSLVFEPIIFVYTCRQLQIKVWDFCHRVYLRGIIPNVALMVLLYFLIHKWEPASYPAIMSVALLAGTAYLFLFTLLTITADERLFLAGKIKNLLKV